MAGMDDVYGKPGHLIRRAQQIAVAIFMEECAALRHHTGAICDAGRGARQSGCRCDAAVGARRLRPFDARPRHRAAGEKGPAGAQARQGGSAREAARYYARRATGCLSRVEPAVRRAQERILAPLQATGIARNSWRCSGNSSNSTTSPRASLSAWWPRNEPSRPQRIRSLSRAVASAALLPRSGWPVPAFA